MPISKNQIKLVTSLQQKKYRTKEGLFVVEGIKVVDEFLNSDFQLAYLFCTEDVKSNYAKVLTEVVSVLELTKLSSLRSPNKVVAVFKIPQQLPSRQGDDLKVALDGINDPGNLGTIIRLCDWFGVKELICSSDTVDCFNSKVVQATMGSLTRVHVVYTDLVAYLKQTQQPLFVADMKGENIHQAQLPSNGIIIMGNEANGISLSIRRLGNKRKITIPQFGLEQTTESLNVATATAIVLNEFRRKG
ncbi:TrmH family RNA methyltransferase [Ochrovirga pacifica]|uniref:TrmH family RNA methyltransferase n=1 Tax=Ochrovirga pacifica TaxID=1042376 RepID=UPI0002559FF2|nr:RNA methyltransferase [Ochrovirga pacifica]